MSIERLDPTGADKDDLLAFLTRNTYPFHVRQRLTEAEVLELIASGRFRDDENDTFWVVDDQVGRIGIVSLEDLEDPTPLFDLRIDEPYRGKGYGMPALAAITKHVFESMPEVTRFEGQTREDNVAMRKIFLRSGWLKEAHYRESWPTQVGAPLASVAYAILRRDWETGETTHFEWEDLTA